MFPTPHGGASGCNPLISQFESDWELYNIILYIRKDFSVMYEIFEDMHRDLHTNVFSLVAADAKLNYKEFSKASNIDSTLVSTVCNELLKPLGEPEDLMWQKGTEKFLEFCVYSVLDMCRVLQDNLDKRKSDTKMDFITYDKETSSIWSKCNVTSLYDFLTTLRKYKFDANIFGLDDKFATGDAELDEWLNHLTCDTSRIKFLDAYVMSCIITRDKYYVSDSFVNAYKSFRLSFATSDAALDSFTGVLLTALFYFSSQDKTLHKFDKKLKRYFDGEFDMKSMLDLRFLNAGEIIKNK